MDKKMLLIVNPAAGRSAYKTYFAEALQLLARAGYRIDLCYTTGRGDASDYAARFAGDYELVACIGGDGTLSEVISGLLKLDSPPPLGYFPMGTSNDVATTLGLPKNNMLEAVKRMLAGTPHPYDVGLFGDEEHFAYIAALAPLPKSAMPRRKIRKTYWAISPTCCRAWPRCPPLRAITPA
jgi:diacylglycerol kinase family enzyme